MEGVMLLQEDHPSSSAVQGQAASSPGPCPGLWTLGYRYVGLKGALDPEASWVRRVLSDGSMDF